jgi:hypothetical protein
MRLRWLTLILSLAIALTTAPAFAHPSPDDETFRVRATADTPDDALTRIKPIADRAYLENIRHEYQGWNNCGPTTVGMMLSWFNINAPQAVNASILKPNSKDVNVSPDEIVNFVRSKGLEAVVRVNGNRDTIMWFLSNGFPVQVEQWIPDEGGMGHYRLATGFNRERGTVTFDDSLYGPDQRWTWEEWEARWSEFNPSRIYIVAYRPEDAPLIRALLGPDASDAQMWVRAEGGARSNLQAFPNDARVWYSLGDALLHQDRAAEALEAFEKGYSLGFPYRYYWYQFGHFEALAKLGRWQRLLQLSQNVLAQAPMHEEMYFYRGLAYQGLGNKDAARDSFRQAILNNKNFGRAQAVLNALK